MVSTYPPVVASPVQKELMKPNNVWIQTDVTADNTNGVVGMYG